MVRKQKAESDRQPAEGMGKFTRLLLADELRWLYLTLVAMIALLGLGLIVLSLERIWSYYYVDSRDFDTLSQAIWYGALGAFFLFAAAGVYQIRKYFLGLWEETDQNVRSIRNALKGFEEDDFERFDEVRRLREEKAQADFERNLGSRISVCSLELRDVLLFPSATWNLQPSVNVLLGRNGYGKSLLLRSLAGVLQRNDEATEVIFRIQAQSGAEPSIVLELERDGERESIHRSPVRFVKSIGKVPLLAIPDSRFLDRSQLILSPIDTGAVNLPEQGAFHFLRQQPYTEVIQGLLYEVCLDYWEHGKSFDLPVFEFIRYCANRLTQADFRFRSITRSGRTGFEIFVSTEGNEEPIPIQHASQGTLSVIAMFGLIRSFLRSYSKDADGELAQKGGGIVLIDEADAHLHPAWQQKVPTMLKDLFPNVQFIVTAHSPLFVAGCWPGEVAVLRRLDGKTARGFEIEQLDRDFVGASSAELYQEIFEIEELDETYLEYSAKATFRQEHTERLAKLTSKQGDGGELTEAEIDEMRRLVEESRRIKRAVEKREERKQQEDPSARIAQLESEILELQTRLAEGPSGG